MIAPTPTTPAATAAILFFMVCLLSCLFWNQGGYFFPNSLFMDLSYRVSVLELLKLHSQIIKSPQFTQRFYSRRTDALPRVRQFPSPYRSRYSRFVSCTLKIHLKTKTPKAQIVWCLSFLKNKNCAMYKLHAMYIAQVYRGIIQIFIPGLTASAPDSQPRQGRH